MVNHFFVLFAAAGYKINPLVVFNGEKNLTASICCFLQLGLVE